MTSDSTSPCRRRPSSPRGPNRPGPPALCRAGGGGAGGPPGVPAAGRPGGTRPAVTRPGFAEIVEDYRVWHVGAFAPEMTGSEALARLSQDIARLLTLGQAAFSGGAIGDILGT